MLRQDGPCSDAAPGGDWQGLEKGGRRKMTEDFQDKAPRATRAIAPTLTSLKVFAAVGQCLSFTQAGKHLGVTQSAVSRQIRQLEDTLDIALFRRVGNNVFLTEAGALLHERLADAFDVMDDAVRDVRATVPRQKLTVLAPPTFAARWLSRRIKEFQQRFPDLDLSLHTHSDDNVRFDCAIRFGVDPKERYTSTRLMIEQHIAVCAPVLCGRSIAITPQLPALCVRSVAALAHMGQLVRDHQA